MGTCVLVGNEKEASFRQITNMNDNYLITFYINSKNSKKKVESNLISYQTCFFIKLTIQIFFCSVQQNNCDDN